MAGSVILDVFLCCVPSDPGGAPADWLAPLGATPLAKWREGAVEIVASRDEAGARAVLAGGLSARDAEKLAHALAARSGTDVELFAATVRARDESRRLVMDAGVRRLVVDPDGRSRSQPMPALDEDDLRYEDAEPRAFEIDPDDLRIAASEFGSGALHAARREARVMDAWRERASERASFVLPAPSLPPRLAAIADAIARGASAAATEQPDGRIRLEIRDGDTKRISFLTPAEHAQLRDATR